MKLPLRTAGARVLDAGGDVVCVCAKDATGIAAARIIADAVNVMEAPDTIGVLRPAPQGGPVGGEHGE